MAPKGGDKGKGGGQHREPKRWGGDKPPKWPTGGGKHEKPAGGKHEKGSKGDDGNGADDDWRGGH